MINQNPTVVKIPLPKAFKSPRRKKGKKCRAMRTDGAYVEAGEQDNLIVQKLKEDPSAYGIFGFSYLNQNSDLTSVWTKLRQHSKISLLASIRLQELCTFT